MAKTQLHAARSHKLSTQQHALTQPSRQCAVAVAIAKR
jgi:hypothetical protein